MEIENSSTILYNVYRHIFRAVIDTWFEDILQKADGSGSILMEGGTTSLEDVVERGEGWRGGFLILLFLSGKYMHAFFRIIEYWSCFSHTWDTVSPLSQTHTLTHTCQLSTDLLPMS